MADPFSGAKTTEVFVTSTTAVSSTDVIDLERLGPKQPEAAAGSNGYSCNITSSQGILEDQMQGHLQTRWSYAEKPLPPRKDSDRPPATAYGPNAANSSLYPTRRYATMEANNAIWSYTKVAVLFFFAMMITWIPSSANRVYSVVHPGQISLPLEFASAFVLPLQGFWNAVIYATTSLPACKQVWLHIKERRRFSGGGIRTMVAAFSTDADREYSGNRAPGGRKGFFQESDSMTELQESRPSTSPGSFNKEGR